MGRSQGSLGRNGRGGPERAGRVGALALLHVLDRTRIRRAVRSQSERRAGRILCRGTGPAVVLGARADERARRGCQGAASRLRTAGCERVGGWRRTFWGCRVRFGLYITLRAIQVRPELPEVHSLL